LHFSDFERQVRTQTVKKYVSLGILEEVSFSDNRDKGIYHQFICVNNKNEPRGCLSCTSINKYIPYRHFKLEGLHTVKDIVEQNDYMGSLDISKYYGHYQVHPAHKRFLRIVVDGVHYQYVGCPFGISNLPFLVTKALRPLLKVWRSKGIRCVNLLDDIKVFHQDPKICAQQMEMISTQLQNLGFIMNTSKEVQPTQQGDVFGLELDTRQLELSIPRKKRKDICQCAKKALLQWTQGSLTIRKMAGFLGKLNFVTPAWTAARTHVTLLIQAKNESLRQERRQWDKLMRPPEPEELAELRYIIEYIPAAPARCFFSRERPSMVITGDASGHGYGAWHEGGGRTEGFWTAEEAAGSSNSRELRTGVLAVLAFSDDIIKLPRDQTGRIRVKYKSDNIVTVAVINRKFARTKFLGNILQPLLDWCNQHGVEVEAEYIPGVQNTLSDEMSRRGADTSDWRLKPQIFRSVQRRWHLDFSVDAFATRLSTQLQRFWSFRSEAGSSGVDALVQDWVAERAVWACPPINQVAKVIRKSEGADVALCVPAWPSAHWWPRLLARADPEYIVLKPGAVEISSSAGRLPRGADRWKMAVFKLSRNGPENRATTRKQRSCWHTR
jgi:hypothetical protein